MIFYYVLILKYTSFQVGFHHSICMYEIQCFLFLAQSIFEVFVFACVILLYVLTYYMIFKDTF